MKTDNWRNLYREGWGSRLRPASFAHPAKNSYGLSVRIYEHAIEEGWIEPGQIVLDPFAGIGGFALEAMRHGLNFVGCEIEQRFVDMGQGCDCTGISKADWVRFQGRWDRARHQDGRHWCPECIMKAAVIAGERKFKVAEKRKIKPLPLPGTKWGALAKTRQAMIFDTAPTASYVRNSGEIPCTEPHRYHGNIETWEAQGMPGTAVIVQGDSRRLTEVLERAQMCISSPPYADSNQNYREGFSGIKTDRDYSIETFCGQARYGDTPGNLGNLPDTGIGFEAALALGSPPFIGSIHEGGHGIDAKKLAGNKAGPNSQALIMDGYGIADGQLARMPEGDLSLAISSPPFGIAETRNRTPFQDGDVADMMSRAYTQDKQGTSLGQLAQMPPGDHAAALDSPCRFCGGTGVETIDSVDIDGNHSNYEIKCRHCTAALEAGAGAETGRAQACISSPPFEGSLNDGLRESDREKYIEFARAGRGVGTNYGTTAGQLGQETGSTFWAASRQILEEVYQVLAPGAHAIWILKMFVRSGRLVDFPGQWEALCQSVGFKTVCKHRAWMNKNAGIVQIDFDGDEVSMELWYKSFFRLICERKGSPRIDWELVLCMEKPN